MGSNYYDLLGVAPTTNRDDITSAWQKLQPQLAKDKDPKKREEASKAYNVLCDPIEREMYNDFYEDKYDTTTASELFNISPVSMAQSAVKEYIQFISQKKANDTCHEIRISLEDFYNGRKMNLKVKRTVFCKHCHGVLLQPCPVCTNKRLPHGCQTCLGLGTIRKPCMHCKNTGQVEEDSNVVINVEKGMKVGEKIRLKGEGNRRNNGADDILVTLKQKEHAVFTRSNNNLFMTKELGVTEALCGCSFVINHLDKRQLVTHLNDVVIAPGCVKVIKGEGMPKYKSTDNAKGDLIVLFQVKFPDMSKYSAGQLQEIAGLLPPPPQFVAPSDPDHETFDLTEYDSSIHMNCYQRPQMYDDDKKDVGVLPTKKPDECVLQ